jgi:hypothetical protein
LRCGIGASASQPGISDLEIRHRRHDVLNTSLSACRSLTLVPNTWYWLTKQLLSSTGLPRLERRVRTTPYIVSETTSHQKTDGDHNDQKRAMFRYIQPAIMTVTGRTWRIGHSIKAFHKTENNDIAYNPKKTSFPGLKQYFRNVNLPLN